VEDLAAVDDALIFTTPGAVMRLGDGDAYPSVLASGLDGASAYLVADARAAYFGRAQQHKWEHWIELGTVPLPEGATAGHSPPE
jgi:hypothetical protein